MSLDLLLARSNPWWQDPAARFRAIRPVARPELGAIAQALARGERAVLLRGLRQVGKTVLLRHTVDHLLDSGCPPGNITCFDFEDERVHRSVGPADVLQHRPAGLDSTRPRFALFDEITRFPGWSKWLKRSVDAARHGTAEERALRIVVTDSSAALLELEAVESGYGRLHEIEVEGITYSTWLKIASDGALEPRIARERIPDALPLYLATGGFTGHVQAALRRELEDLRHGIRKDVVAAGIHRDLGRMKLDADGMEELFRYLIEDSGAIFSRKERAEDVGADPRAVAGWMRHLESCHLVATLPRFAGRATKRLRESRKPKVYAGDHGLVAAFAAAADPLREPDVRGRLHEAAVFRHLRDVARARDGRLTFFRDDRAGLEIDFVLEIGGELLAVDVKGAATPDRAARERARRATAACGADRALLVHGGRESSATGGLASVALEDFLLDPAGALREASAP